MKIKVKNILYDGNKVIVNSFLKHDEFDVDDIFYYEKKLEEMPRGRGGLSNGSFLNCTFYDKKRKPLFTMNLEKSGACDLFNELVKRGVKAL